MESANGSFDWSLGLARNVPFLIGTITLYLQVQHSGVLPFPEQLAEHFAARACGSVLDLYVGYDEHALATSSRNFTMFQTPFGAMRLTTLPMGWTNSVPIFHGDVTYILQPEIPHVTQPYIDDVPVRGPKT